MFSVRAASTAAAQIIDVDGSYLYRKQQQLSSSSSAVVTLPIPVPPITGWESVSAQNANEMSANIPAVTPGVL